MLFQLSVANRKKFLHSLSLEILSRLLTKFTLLRNRSTSGTEMTMGNEGGLKCGGWDMINAVINNMVESRVAGGVEVPQVVRSCK